MNVLAVVPARSGSKRVPRKQLRKIDGRSLVAIACRDAQEADCDVVVSTDAMEFADGFEWCPRPQDLSGDAVDISEVTRHALLWKEERMDKRYDMVVTLQPATPLRTPGMIRSMLDAMERLRCMGGITGCPVVPWHWTWDKGCLRSSWAPGPYPRSQDCPGHGWQEINCVQIAHRSVVMEGKRWGLPLLIHLMPPYAVLDIDTEEDLQRAQLAYGPLRALLERDEGCGQLVAYDLQPLIPKPVPATFHTYSPGRVLL